MKTRRKLPAFLHHEAAGGVVLFAAAALAMALANSPLATDYGRLIEFPLGATIGLCHAGVDDETVAIFHCELTVKRARVGIRDEDGEDIEIPDAHTPVEAPSLFPNLQPGSRASAENEQEEDAKPKHAR